ncbi:hypothetical protein JHJ32_05955 [Parapedobacter sp. ISTM3]|nr:MULTISPECIES: hypothetical protein [Parapedobacter]MBK1439520.1 hypothetical protein [Parapedobacter sp. ISTM3]
MALDDINTSSFSPNTSFGERILYGVQKALRKLAEETAMKGGSLVVKIDGEIKEVPAKELLKTLPEQGG